jgi:hypothetical protein
MSGSHLSQEFFLLVKSIGESKSKQEEDRIIADEVQALKKRMPEATVGRRKVRIAAAMIVRHNLLAARGAALASTACAHRLRYDALLAVVDSQPPRYPVQGMTYHALHCRCFV